MQPKRHLQSPPRFDFDPDIQQGPRPQGKRRRQVDGVPDPAAFFENPYYHAQLMTPGLATISGGGIQHGFIKTEQPSGPSFTARRRPDPPILVAGHGLLELNLDVPPALGDQEVVRRKRALLYELQYQKDNAPRLPPSRVADLPPKKELPPYYDIPPGLDAEFRQALEDKKNRLSKRAQELDRERNNLAAKKSRSLRLEDLAGYREMCAKATAKVFFHRLVDVAAGRNPDSWERLPGNVQDDLVAVVRKAIKKGEDQRAAKKKATDAEARTRRVQDKKTQPAAAASESPAPYEQPGDVDAQNGLEDDAYAVETPEYLF